MSGVVNTWNEWDPLEEVVVGTAWGAHMPSTMDPLADGAMISGMGGQPYPLDLIHRVQSQIDRFVEILKAEGVTVKGVKPYDLALRTTTPYFSVPCGYNFMNVRDLVLVIGNEIIEAPSASRSRYFETLIFRDLFKQYFLQGARWVAAPRPQLSAETYNSPEARRALNLKQEITSEFEPVFDAADFVRCGRDIFGQRGARTNKFGIEWLSRHLGNDFRVHEIPTQCEFAVHIDTTFVPIGPGRALVNPHWIGKLPAVLSGWDIIEAPDPEGTSELFPGIRYETSDFIAMNVFLLDQKRIFVDFQQKKLIALLTKLGMRPIAIPFDLPPFLGGAFHCVTLDIRRRGELLSYCP